MGADETGAGESSPGSSAAAVRVAAATGLATARRRSAGNGTAPGAVGGRRARSTRSSPPYDLATAEAEARARLAGMADRDIDLFVLRLRRYWPDLVDGLHAPYGTGTAVPASVLRAIVPVLVDAYRAPISSRCF